MGPPSARAEEAAAKAEALAEVPRNIVFTNLLLLRLAGWWGDGRWALGVRAAYAAYTACNIFLHLVLVVSVVINMFIERRDFSVVLDAAGIFWVGMTNGAKIFPFVFSRYKVERCVRRLARMEAAGLPSPRRHVMVLGARRLTSRVGWLLIGTCMFTCGAWLLVPLFAFASAAGPALVPVADAANDSDALLALDADGGTTGHKPLPLQGWLPFDTSASPGWELAYVLLSLSTTVDSWIACQTNNIYFSLVYFACTQLRALNDSLRQLRAEALLRLKLPAGAGHAQGERAFQQEMARGLRQAVLHHQAIISLVAAVQDLLGSVMFMECLAMSIMLCCVTFQATMVSPTSVKFLALALFLFFEMLELLLFCSVGTQLELLSSTVADAAFDCGWEDCAPPFKSSLRFMMMRAQKPSRVTALGFATLSLPLFMSLLRMSYSYYALLRQVNEPE